MYYILKEEWAIKCFAVIRLKTGTMFRVPHMIVTVAGCITQAVLCYSEGASPAGTLPFRM